DVYKRQSLMVARVLTPMMAAYLLKPVVGAHREPFWMGPYQACARWCLHHRFVTMALSALFFIGSIALIPLLPTGFIPPDDNSQTQVYLQLPPGSTLPQTMSAAEDVRQRHQQPEERAEGLRVS
ncbi:MAG: efflux RND transporter permease subunit, partial [Actinobacteria bacterium]|nr:efflux RND transporter permease subunit [Actinomycetota bacterium]